MGKQEAILEGNDRNFTINFGPQHPATHGVLRVFVKSFASLSVIAVLCSSAFASDVSSDVSSVSEVLLDAGYQPEDVSALKAYTSKVEAIAGENAAEVTAGFFGNIKASTTAQKDVLEGMSDEDKAFLKAYDGGELERCVVGYQYLAEVSLTQLETVGPQQLDKGLASYASMLLWKSVADLHSELGGAPASESNAAAAVIAKYKNGEELRGLDKFQLVKQKVVCTMYVDKDSARQDFVNTYVTSHLGSMK